MSYWWTKFIEERRWDESLSIPWRILWCRYRIYFEEVSWLKCMCLRHEYLKTRLFFVQHEFFILQMERAIYIKRTVENFNPFGTGHFLVTYLSNICIYSTFKCLLEKEFSCVQCSGSGFWPKYWIRCLVSNAFSFVVRRSMDVLDQENKPGSESLEPWIRIWQKTGSKTLVLGMLSLKRSSKFDQFSTKIHFLKQCQWISSEMNMKDFQVVCLKV